MTLAEGLARNLANRYPDACIEVLKDTERVLKNMEAQIGVVLTSTLRLSRDFLLKDSKTHVDAGTELYERHGGRVGG